MSESREVARSPQTGKEVPSLAREISRRVYAKSIPINTTFEITQRCNIRCHHCYNFDREEPYPKSRIGRELETDEIRRILDQLAEAGCLYLNLTGGEAIMHPDILDIVRHARKRYMLVKVKSNGTLLTAEKARALREAGAFGVDISLYGASEETYSAFTRIPQAYRRTMAGIEAALQVGLKVRLSIPILKSTVHELDRMTDFARRNNLTFVADPHITTRYDGSRSSADERVGREKLDQLYRGALRPWLRGPNSSVDQAPQCSCARSTCGISAFGDVYPCIGAPVVSGNLRKESFNEIWTQSPVLRWIRGLQLDDFPVCKPCPHRIYCRRSSGAVYSNTGDYTGPEDWTCMEGEILHRLHDQGLTATAPSDSGNGAVQRHSLDTN